MIFFLTGGSGFLGKEVIARLVKQKSCKKIIMLLREGRRQSAAHRLEEIRDKIFGDSAPQQLKSKLAAVSGDLTEVGLGILEDGRQRLLEEVTHVLHLGASTDFGAPIEVSRQFNVEGTREVLSLALDLRTHGKLQRFDYVSTAYVAGTKSGSVSEQELQRGQSFANAYEQSKYEAELLVRDYRQLLPIAIHRPSIVVGNSKNGFTPHFKVLYWPIRLLAKGLLPFFPANRHAVLDVVPVDYVASGIVALLQDPEAVGHTFHLTAGSGRETQLLQVVRDSYRYAGVKPVRTLPCWLFDFIKASFLRKFFREEFWHAVEIASPYRDYVYGTGVRFENAATARWLKKYGIQSPLWSEYCEEVLGFCIESSWGKRLPKQESEYYQDILLGNS